MCGIAGILNFNQNPISDDLLNEMGLLIAHRGPDDQGVYNKNGVGLVNRRLAIIDLTQSGHQPMSNEEGSVWITYNGEIYNFLEIRQELEQKGYHFRSGTDTEVILYAYEEWGMEHCKRLRGMFAYAIWDEKKHQLAIVRDRLGVKPVSYAMTDDGLVFGSELRTLLIHPQINRQVDMSAIHAYLTRAYVPAPLTAFEGIQKLPPAHYLVAQGGKIRLTRYWDVDFGDDLVISEQEACEQIRHILEEATRIRLMSDVPLGAFLSGGVDSSSVVAMMSRNMSEAVKTFSIHFDEDEFNETPYARIVADHFQTDHYEFNIQPNAMEVLPELVWHYGEPFGDYSAIPTYYVSKLAREHVTVALSGDAGDESFGGYNRYRTAEQLELYRKLPIHLRRDVVPGFLNSLGRISGKRNAFHRLETVARRGAASPAEAYFYSYSLFTPEAAEGIWQRLWADRIDMSYLQTQLNHELGRFSGSTLLERLQFLDLHSYLPDDINVKVDIASMANSLEVRSPYLDHKLVEFAAKLPANMKRRGKEGKYILKKALEPLLPKDILYRKKHGFSMPVDAWFRGPLRNLVRSVLLDPSAQRREYFNSERIESLIIQHESGAMNHGARLWLLLNFELWHQTYIDQLRKHPVSVHA